MVRKTLRVLLPLLVAASGVLAIAPFVYADDGGRGDRDRPDRAVSYINPDLGMPAFNPDVDPNSSCFRPDQSDSQRLSDPGTTNRNVHNDACFFGRDGGGYWGSRSSNEKVDGPASFDSQGVGFISACPDPDNAGPKFARTIDRNSDGLADVCFQSGYQEKGMAGDKEFHARLNNTSTPGRQSVTWCYDRDQNGCRDEYRLKASIVIDWTR